MPNGSVLLFVLFAFICLITGFISNGEGTQSNKLSGIFGLIAILGGIGCIIASVFWKYWIGILITLLIYLVMLNVGGSIMRRALYHSRRQ